MKDKGKDVREAAAYALGELKDPRAVEPLISALKDKDSYVRREAAEALKKINPKWMETEEAKGKVPEFIFALKDEESKKSDSLIPVVKALEEGLIKKVRIKGGEKTVLLEIERDSKDKTPKILIPAGVTKFGFIENNAIESRRGWVTKFSEDGAEIWLYEFTATNSFSGDGFSLDMQKDVIVMLEKGKTKASIPSKGSLN